MFVPNILLISLAAFSRILIADILVATIAPIPASASVRNIRSDFSFVTDAMPRADNASFHTCCLYSARSEAT